MKSAVITTVRGRTQHLRRQLEGLATGALRPDHHVIVAMDDPEVARTVGGYRCPPTVVEYDFEGSRLPLSVARNLGAETALDGGAELLIFLDVDCIPAVAMVDHYVRAAADPLHCDALLCGTVAYLPPPPPQGYDLAALPGAQPHPARPAPGAGEVLLSTEYDLFWSLSFAATAPTWHRVGGFCTDYRGYGGEDTDFAQVAAAAGVTMRWVGGAHAFHQHHPVSSPPVEHLHDIVTNARTFHRRWGRWPMEGWLRAFAERGLIRWSADSLQLCDGEPGGASLALQ